MNQDRFFQVVADALQLRSDQPLTGKAVTARAIDSEQLAAMVYPPLQFKAGLDVGILLSASKNPEHMIEPLLCGIVLGLIPVTLLGLFVAAWNQYRRGGSALGG